MKMSSLCLGSGQGHANGNDHFAGLIVYLQSIFAFGLDHEERFHVIFLDEDRGYLDDCFIASGNAAHLPIRLRDIFSHALKMGSRALIVAHNHPSGDCRPSNSDIQATKRLSEIGRALDIELLDHLILTREKVYSMRAGGKI